MQGQVDESAANCPPVHRRWLIESLSSSNGQSWRTVFLTTYRSRQRTVKMASSTFKQVALAATRTLSQRGAPLASRQRAVFASSSSSLISARRAASSQATQIEMTTPADAPQIVPTAEEMAKDPQLAGLGYPQLPNVSRQTRPALANWWDRQER